MEMINEKGPNLLELVIKKDLGIELSAKEELAYLNMDPDDQKILDDFIENSLFLGDIDSIIDRILSKENYTEEEKKEMLFNWKKKKEAEKKELHREKSLFSA